MITVLFLYIHIIVIIIEKTSWGSTPHPIHYLTTNKPSWHLRLTNSVVQR